MKGKKHISRKNKNTNGFIDRIFPIGLRNYIIKNHLQLIGILIGSILAIGIGYWTISDPDIRILYKQTERFKLLDHKLDENGNYIYYFTSSINFKNLSIRSGFIDKIEISPLSIATIPESRIISIEKTSIGLWEEKQIEVKFLIIIPSSVIMNLERDKNISMEVLLNFFDNTGRLINRFDTGPIKYGRYKLDLEQEIKIEVKKILLK